MRLLGEEKASGAGTEVSFGADFVRGAEAGAGVLVMGVVVCDSGVEA